MPWRRKILSISNEMDGSIYLFLWSIFVQMKNREGLEFRVPPWSAFQPHGGFLPHSLEGGC
jgi:hypothetical protein